LYISGNTIFRPYPEPPTSATWDSTEGFGGYVYSDYQLNPQWVNCETSYPDSKYNYTGTGVVYGSIPSYTNTNYSGATNWPCSEPSCHTIWVDLWNGSYAPGVTVPPYVPVVYIQLRIAYKDGQCYLQSRSFSFEDSYAASEAYNNGDIPNFLNASVTYPLEDYYTNQEITDSGEATNPWTDDAIPMPLNGVLNIGLNSEWFSGGVTGVTVYLDCGNCGPEPTNTEQTYTVTLNGGPSWAPSSISGKPGETIELNASVGRTHESYRPNGYWTGPYAPIQRRIRYATTWNNAAAIFSFQPGGNSSLSCGPSLWISGTKDENAYTIITGTESYENGIPAPQYDYTTKVDGSVYYSAEAAFVAEPIISNRNSADSVTYNGIWYLIREGTGMTTDIGDGACVSYSKYDAYRTGSITITRNACVGAETADVSVSLSGGQIDGIVVNAGGQCYSGPPALSISGGGGAGATAYANVANGHVTDIVITNGGSDYTSDPTVSPFTVNGLSTGISPVIMPEPCSNEECEQYLATWLVKPVISANGNEDNEWFLINDCPGTCVSKPHIDYIVDRPTFIDVKCGCP
jgi:hypothetical protein